MRNILGLLLALVLVPLAALAQQDAEETIPQRLDRWESEARAIERELELAAPGGETIARHLETLGHQLDRVPAMKERLSGQLAPLRSQLEALGAPPEDASTEAPQIALERQRLTGEIATLEAYEKRADQAQARAKGLETQLVQLRREQFSRELLTRGPSLFDHGMPQAAAAALLRTGRVIALETTTRIAAIGWEPAAIARLVGPVLLLAIGMVLLFKVRKRALSWLLGHITADAPFSRRVTVGAGITVGRLLLPAGAVLLILAGLFASGLFGGQGRLLLEGLANAAMIVIGAYALGGAFFAPTVPLLRLSVLGDQEAKLANRRLILLAGVVGLDRALVVQGEQIGLAVEGLAALNMALLALGGVALWLFVRSMRPPSLPEPADADAPPEEDGADATPQAARASIIAARFVARAAALAAPVLAIFGFYAAARFAFYPLVFSGAVIGLCILLYHVVQSIVSALWLNGHDADPTLARLRLIPILVAFLLICAAAPVLALLWGATPADLAVAWRTTLQGFRIGDVVISPVDFALFLLVAVIGLFLTGRFKRMLKGSVLPYTGLDAGGRDAIAAGAGYLGIVVTVLVAISTTGVDLSNLAIVAGALSVGIGFGLQNIVNNFVSGIILLIERPIKAGDWIELPSGMGYVKTINVRSTEVQTFDRSTLFVPNSQLISENVINWTHENLNGRIIVKVGVDYSSDPRKVERVLLEIAKGHPLLLRRPAPYVLFRSFGADSLDFEIRGILRDVNWLINVQSDINFEIARRFQEEGISIPFRQADIAIRNPEQIGAALRGAFAQPRTAATADAAPGEAEAAVAPPPRRRAGRGSAAGQEASEDGGGDGDR